MSAPKSSLGKGLTVAVLSPTLNLHLTPAEPHTLRNCQSKPNSKSKLVSCVTGAVCGSCVVSSC